MGGMFLLIMLDLLLVRDTGLDFGVMFGAVILPLKTCSLPYSGNKKFIVQGSSLLEPNSFSLEVHSKE